MMKSSRSRSLMTPGGLISTAVVAVAVSLTVQVLLNCPIEPRPSPPPPTDHRPPNNLLQGLEKLGDGQLSRPEDVYVDKEGTMYTATMDGWLQRSKADGSWEKWRFVGGTGLVGITPSVARKGLVGITNSTVGTGLAGITPTADPSMLVCDADKGLLKVDQDGSVTILTSTVEGAQIKFINAAIQAKDGTVYFSESSTRFPFDRWIYDFMEFSSTGRLHKYDPVTKKASVLLENLSFANGVALSKDQDYVIVCQSWRYLCTKLWLTKEKDGQVETFIDNLPGCPDNIHVTEDGSFWIALVQLRSPWLDLVTRWTLSKRILASFPKLLAKVQATAKGAKIVKVSEYGKITRVLDDSEGKVINFVSSVSEYKGDIFFGSLKTNFIGKLSLAKVPLVEGATEVSWMAA